MDSKRDPIRCGSGLFVRGAEGIRTPGLLIANEKTDSMEVAKSPDFRAQTGAVATHKLPCEWTHEWTQSEEAMGTSQEATRQAVELGRMPGANDPAPEGYEWAMLGQAYPTFSGSPALALMCMTCTALVGVPEAHTAWHAERS